MHEMNSKIEEIVRELKKLHESYDLETKRKRLRELEVESMRDDLWDDQDKARKVMQQLSDLKSEIEDIENLTDEIYAMYSISKEDGLTKEFESDLKKIEKELSKFKIASFLSGPYDRRNALLSIHAGQGGTEAMDWTNMLYRMYLRYAENRGWKTDVLDLSEGEEAGIKSVTINIKGQYAYGYLKGEAGTHRLVRQSPFNADNLRQTSFALVEVLPELEESDASDIVISEEDLEWQFYRSSGKGGQNVNKVSTAVRLKHIPSDIVVTSQTQRRQEQNRANALAQLRAKLWIRKQEMERQKLEDIKGDYTPAAWGTQIRSYVLHPYKMVKDLRTEVESSNPESVLDGNLEKFIDAEVREL